VRQIHEHFGRIDIVIANAGILRRASRHMPSSASFTSCSTSLRVNRSRTSGVSAQSIDTVVITFESAPKDSTMIRIAGLVGGGLPAMAVAFHASHALSQKSVGVSPSSPSSDETNFSSRPTQSRTRSTLPARLPRSFLSWKCHIVCGSLLVGSPTGSHTGPTNTRKRHGVCLAAAPNFG
jgi:hypothetical protein